MKKIVFILAFSAASVALCAQTGAFNKGDLNLNLQVGLSNALAGSSWNTVIPPVSAAVDYGIVDGLINGKASVGIGGYLGFSTVKWGTSQYNDYTATYIVPAARGTFHYQFVENLDTYAGASIGYNIISYSADYVKNKSGLYTGIFVGGRWYFSPTFAAGLEAGYGISWLEAGITLKF
jgi:hypothetical protein